MMTLKCGTNGNLRWEWESSDRLICLINEETGEDITKFEYEDLIGFVSALEKIKFDRLKEDGIKS